MRLSDDLSDKQSTSAFLLRSQTFRQQEKVVKTNARRKSRDQIVLMHRQADIQDLYPEVESHPLQFLVLSLRKRRQGNVGVPDRRPATRAVESRAEQERSTREVVDARRIERHADLHGLAEIEGRPCLLAPLQNLQPIGITQSGAQVVAHAGALHLDKIAQVGVIAEVVERAAGAPGRYDVDGGEVL